MERVACSTRDPSKTHSRWRGRIRQRSAGAAMVEAVIALPILLAVILGAIQFGLIYEAKATLNFAALQAARAGAVGHAQPAAIRGGLARGLAPLYSPDSSVAGVAATIARVNASLVQDARIRILNPTREAFEDFGEEVEGVREIPNDRLHARSTSVGALSGVNVQDANLLRVEITYGYELKVPLVNWFISRILLSARRVGNMDAFEQQLLRRGRLPIVTTSTVRMQSPARMSDAVVARGDLPDVDRIPADARPPDDAQDDDGEGEEGAGDSESGEQEGSSLADGFFGFGEGSGDGSGGGSSPGTGGGGGSGTGSGGGAGGGGANGGSSTTCSGGDGGSSPFPSNPGPPGDSSPVTPGPGPFPISGNGGDGASLPSVELPSLSVGNPIHVVTGNKYQREIDLPALPGTLGLSLVRHYNSEASARAGVMGAGWRHGYEASIESGADGESLLLWQADGRRLRFAGSKDSSRFVAQRASDGVVEKSDEGYVWRWRSGRELQFDRSGRLTVLREQSRIVTLHYDDQQRLQRVVDPQRRELSFEYYANGRIARIRAPGGASWRYGYDAAGNLSQVVSASGRARHYEYNDSRHPHHLTDLRAGSVRLPAYGGKIRLIPVAHWEYDAAGRGILSSHPDAAGKVSLEYGKGYTDVTDAFGRVSRYVTDIRDGVALVTEVRGPGCGTCGVGDVRYAFNDAFQVETIEARGSPSQRYAYDDERRLILIERDQGAGYERVVQYSYDGDADQPSHVELPSIKPGAVRSIEVKYTRSGLPLSFLERGYTPSGESGYERIERTIRFDYDAHSTLLAIDGPRTDLNDVTRFQYDDFGRTTAILMPGDERVEFSDFDPAGRPRLMHQPGSPPKRVEYDEEGRLTRMTQLFSSGERSTGYVYDGLGRLTETVDADGRIRRIGYDQAGRPNRFALDESGIGGVLKYAADGQVVAAALLMPGNIPVRWFQYVYDEQRRLMEVRDGDGPPLRQFAYTDDDSQPARITDPLGNATEFAYGFGGMLESMQAADGGVTRFRRDDENRLAGVVAPNGAATNYRYDDFGRQVQEDSADRGTLRYAYDRAGNLAQKEDANGEIMRFQYDAANRLLRIHRREDVTELSYRSSRLVEIVAPQQKERFGYDENGRLVTHERRIANRSFTTSQTFDAQNRLDTRTLPSGQRLRYHYTQNGALRAITRESMLRSELILGDLDARTTEKKARPLDAMGRLTYGNGLELRNLYEPKAGYLERRTLLGLAAFKYAYDDSGRLTGISDGRTPRSYDYDATGRLTAARIPAGEFTYAYDKNGNRRSSSAPSATDAARDFRYAANSNRLLEEHIAYDRAGNPLQIANRRYEYNSEGRPISLHVDGKLVATYRYNTAGERISKTLYKGARPETTFYLYERHQLIAEADERGKVTREYLYLGAHPVALMESGRIFWIHTDHLGTPVSITDATRRVVWSAEYEPFGVAHIDEDPDGDNNALTLNLRFPGQYADAESGTYYNVMRDYDPETGRYLTPDPLGLFDGANKYAYVHGNPISHSDSLGLYDEVVHYYMTYFLALVAGLPQDVARTIAIATQYIDRNPLTMPTTQIGPVPTGSNDPALPLYHFVLNYSAGQYGDRTSDILMRFQNPSSTQLSNLLASTDPARLRELWVATHPTGTPGLCPMPSFTDINNARYQLYGEYLHAFEDTFAHRDSLNMPYAIESSGLNTPIADTGHFGVHGPSGYEAPDRTFNQDDRPGDSQCRILHLRRGPIIVRGLTEQECERRGQAREALGSEFTPPPEEPSRCEVHHFLGGAQVINGLTRDQCMAWTQRAARVTYTPPDASHWRYNELRTLRMESEVFNMLTTTFQDEIARNRQNLGASVPQITWRELAGREAWDESSPQANARIGLEQTFDDWRESQGLSEVNLVLQKFNASTADEEDRLEILNEWLAVMGLRNQQGEVIEIEPWPGDYRAARNRWDNIGWIPTGSFTGLLLPRDEECQPIRNIPGNCEDQPRR